MLCFDVYKNGQRVCRAGIGNSGVLSVILSWVGREGKRRKTTEQYHSDLHIGGLYHPEPNVNTHVRWPDPKLHVGDELLVRLVEADDPDVPTSTTVDDPVETERMQRTYYEALKRQFEPSGTTIPEKTKTTAKRPRKRT